MKKKKSILSKRRERLGVLCCDDKATLFVFVLNTISFIVVSVGLIIYFLQYNYSDDKSDEKWIYPFIWSVPCIAWLTGLFIQLAASFKYEKPLLLLPIFSVISVLSLAFLCFIFYDASTVAANNKICNSGSSESLLFVILQGRGTQDSTCVVTKDGQQLCGHKAIRKLCNQIETGFYLIFMGCILMSGLQILMIVTGCIRRSRLAEERSDGEYVGLVNQ